MRLLFFTVLLLFFSKGQGTELVLIVSEPSQGSQVLLVTDENQPSPRQLQLVPGNTYTLMCSSPSGGFQQQQVWFRDDSPVEVRGEGNLTAPGQTAVYAVSPNSNQWNLVFDVLSSDFSGTYSCRRPDGRVTVQISTGNPVVVAGSPVVSLNLGIQPNFPVLDPFISGSPQPTPEQITWTFNGEPRTPVSPPQYLLSNNIDLDFAGDYVCTATVGDQSASATFTVAVNVQPVAVISPSQPLTVNEGSTLSLVCNDSAGLPAPDFSWTRGSTPLTSDDRVDISPGQMKGSSVLTIANVGPDDAGEYQCIANNSAGTSESPYLSVEVLFAPILAAVSNRTNWAVGNTLVLQATVERANPMTYDNYEWSIDGTPITEGNSSNGGSFSLTKPNLTLEDEGVYLLEVANSIGIGRITFPIIVESPPTLEAVLSPVRALSNAPNTTLSVAVSGGKPPVQSSQISWSYNGAVLELGSGRYTSLLSEDATSVVLVMASPGMEDSGEYTVLVQHSAGSVSLGIELLVLDPPLGPANLNGGLIQDSACEARVTWVIPPSLPITAATDWIILEAQVSGETEWVELSRVGSGVTEAEVLVPSSGIDTMILLRGRGLNNELGEGGNVLADGPFTAWPQGALPSVPDLSSRPISPTSIMFSWTLPDPLCFVFESHSLTCADGGVSMSSGSLEGQAISGSVGGLEPDTLYNCSLTSIVTDSVREMAIFETVTASRQAFTYPSPPPNPAMPMVNQTASTSSTFTVDFELPPNPEDISHYQVVIVRLLTQDLPSESPDIKYPPGYTFDTPTEVKTRGVGAYIAAEIAGDQFNTSFTAGDGLLSNGFMAAYTNPELTSGALYTCFLRVFPKTLFDRGVRVRRQTDPLFANRQYDVFSSSAYLPVQQTTSTGSVLGLAVGVAVGVVALLVLILLAIVIGTYCYLRTRNTRKFRVNRHAQVDDDDDEATPASSSPGTPSYNHESPDLGRRTNGIELRNFNMISPAANGSLYEPVGPIKSEDFASHVEKFDANRQLYFNEEYEFISNTSQGHPAEASEHPLNTDKNRYNNVKAFDHTRVKLTPAVEIECSDYINANYIQGHSGETAYIATQGPLDQTVVEFWQMVWEQNTTTIIMLTNLVELGKVKCSQYWPVNGTVIYSGVKVTLDSMVELPDYIIRNLQVTSVLSNETRSVLLFQFTCWPDYGVPLLAAPLLNFLRAVNSANTPDSGPVIVHCSAGVGRSGTVIAIDLCLKQLELEGYMDPCACVQKMRNQRNYMVQTETQYAFIHFALLEAIIYGDTSAEMGKFSSAYSELHKVDPVFGETFIEAEFRKLGSVKTMTKKSSFQNKLKHKGAPQRHFNSSFMGSISSSSAHSLEPFSAHYMDTYSDKKRLIICDGPIDETVAKWWQMVWDEDVAYIVNLDPQDEKTLMYWSSEGSVQYGSIVVEVETESAEHLYTKRKIRLSNAKVEGISHSVTQYHFLGWTTQFVPRVSDFLAFMVDIIDGADSLQKHQRILMHDIESLGPCGIMTALYYCIERLRTERMVDVFQAVQLVRLQRPGCVRTAAEYAFIYDCVNEFIQTRSSQ